MNLNWLVGWLIPLVLPFHDSLSWTPLETIFLHARFENLTFFSNEKEKQITNKKSIFVSRVLHTYVEKCREEKKKKKIFSSCKKKSLVRLWGHQAFNTANQ